MKFKDFDILDVTEKATRDINRLLVQLSDKAKSMSRKELKEIVDQFYMSTFVAVICGKIVGMASIYFRQTMMRRTGIIDIEDVVVDKKHRGKGIGKKLTELLIEEAKKRKVNCVELTSKPSRKEANAMYESMGFKKRDTNHYRLDLFV